MQRHLSFSNVAFQTAWRVFCSMSRFRCLRRDQGRVICVRTDHTGSHPNRADPARGVFFRTEHTTSPPNPSCQAARRVRCGRSGSDAFEWPHARSHAQKADRKTARPSAHKPASSSPFPTHSHSSSCPAHNDPSANSKPAPNYLLPITHRFPFNLLCTQASAV